MFVTEVYIKNKKLEQKEKFDLGNLFLDNIAKILKDYIEFQGQKNPLDDHKFFSK